MSAEECTNFEHLCWYDWWTIKAAPRRLRKQSLPPAPNGSREEPLMSTSTSRFGDDFNQFFEDWLKLRSILPHSPRHRFVPDSHGFYCLACSLPPANSRHAVGERVQ